MAHDTLFGLERHYCYDVLGRSVMQPAYVRRPPPTIIVVGAGGIGARVLQLLTRAMVGSATIYLVDPDIVEDRNIHRQVFTVGDVGEPKVIALARRYQTRGCNIYGIQARIEDVLFSRSGQTEPSDLMEAFDRTICPVIIIGCVDNVAARAHLLKQVKAAMLLDITSGLPSDETRAVVYIDTGNDKTVGQVLVSGNIQVLNKNSSPSSRAQLAVKLHGYMAQPELFDDTREHPNESRPSCTEMPDTQTVTANQLAATIAVQAMITILEGKYLSSIGWSFDLSAGSMVPVPFVLGPWIVTVSDRYERLHWAATPQTTLNGLPIAPLPGLSERQEELPLLGTHV